MAPRESLPSLMALVADDTPTPAQFAERGISQLHVLLNLYRWVCLTGVPPSEDDWDAAPAWPSSQEVARAFGSWHNMQVAAELDESPVLKAAATVRQMADEGANVLEERRREIRRAEQRIETRERQVEKQLAKAEARHADQKQKADAARSQLAELKGALALAERERQRALDQLRAVQDERDRARREERTREIVEEVRDGELAYSAWADLAGPAARARAQALLIAWLDDGTHADALTSVPQGLTEIETANGRMAVQRDERSFIVFWSHPLAGEETQRVGVEVKVDEVGAGIRLRVHPGGVTLSPPRLARDWAQQQVWQDAGQTLSDKPLLLDREQIVPWLEEVAFSPARQLPVLLLGPEAPVSAAGLARTLTGRAWVAQLDAQAGWEFTEHYGRDWAVWGDAVRVIWPGADPQISDPHAHPRSRPDSVPGGNAERHLLDTVTRSRSHAHDAGRRAFEALQSEADRRRAAEQQISELQEQVVGLEAALAAARREAGRLREQTPERPAVPADLPVPQTPLEAVRIASERCVNLRFAPGAFESAEASPYRFPETLLDALMKLDRLSEAYAQGSMGQALADAAEQLGLRWSGGLSSTTLSRYARHYTYRFEGLELTMGPHVSLGSGSGAGKIARVYLTAHEGDEQLRRGLIVAHAGVHLPDSTT